MTRPGLIEGAVVAFAASVFGGGAFALLAPLLGRADALHAVIAGVALGYLLYLVARSRVRAGRVALPGAWAVLTATALLAGAGPAAHLLLQCVLVALARALCFHRGVLPAMAGLGLAAAGLAAAAFALERGAGLALATWSLMLVQSLFVLIPARGAAAGVRGGDDDDFGRALRAAEAATRRLEAGR